VIAHKPFVFTFADVEVREREFCVVRGGEVLPVEPKAFRVLVFLLRNPHRLITKDELLDAVWNDCAVSENSLTRSIALLRRLLGDDTREPRYIATVPTVGYRFLCDVQVTEDGFTRLGKDDPHPPPAIDSSIPAKAEGQQKQQSDGSRKKSTGLLLAALVAATLGMLVVGFLVRRAFSKHDVVGQAVAHQPTEQRVTSNPPEAPVRGAVISPDGKYVVYSDPTGLYVRQISSGETRPWSLPKGFLAWPQSWFPDGTHLLVRRIDPRPQDSGLSLWKTSLYELSMLGGEPQEMVNNAKAGYVSPDGSRIAYLPLPNANEVWTPDANEMWMMDSDGANPRRVASAGEKKYGIYPNWIYPVAWSPTGQHLAYIENHIVAGPVPVEPTHSLRIIGPNGEGTTVVLDDPRIGEALWWAPDGRILFSYREDPASSQANYGVYSIHVDERTGKATGPPQPTTQAEGTIRSMSGTADGKRLVLWRSSGAWQVFIASLDAASHQWKEPRRLTLDANVNIATAWTADSKAVLFISNRNGTWKLFKQAIDETTPEVLAEGRSISLPRLSADGSHVLYLSSSIPDDVSFPVSLMSKPLAGGTPRVVIQGKGIWNHQCANSPATLCIFSKHDGQDQVFRSFDLEHGAGRELLRIPDNSSNWSLSSDGSKLAIFLDRHRIRFVSLGTGAAHEVTVKDWPLDNGDWAANNQTVFMPSRAPNGLPVILEVDQTGKAKVVLQGSANIKFGFMIQSPDGKYGVLAAGVPGDNNVWMVEKF
jgi:DNA-binding winged helix-turn-helix (wHTH) protein/Tol biopolymer transport system component